MAKSNRSRVEDILNIVREGLGPFVVQAYYSVHGEYFLREMEQVLTTNAYSVPHLANSTVALEKIDTQGWLNLMMRQWNEIFKNKLGQTERNYVGELINYRNAWAHEKPFSNEDAQRVADTATYLLESVGAKDYADQTRKR
jgi:hypothetical protein